MFIAIVSDNPEKRKSFCKLIGKETGSGDISFYSSNFQGKIRTIIEPALYPEKIQPLLHALAIADYVVVLADSLTPQIGEIMVSLDLLKKEEGAILSPVELPLKGTVLEKYKRLDSQEDAKREILSLSPPDSPAAGDSPLLALVDSSFAVKSVGNVALGALKEGNIKKRDRLTHLPSKSEIEVKSIQLNDADSEEVSAGGRFGICYKGELLERGILSREGSGFSLGTSISGTFSKSPFYKNELPKKLHACSLLQFVECSISGDKLELERDFAYRENERILLVDPGNPKLRICGVFVAQGGNPPK
jgi:selenocysteine-specific translation elongation factor